MISLDNFFLNFDAIVANDQGEQWYKSVKLIIHEENTTEIQSCLIHICKSDLHKL